MIIKKYSDHSEYADALQWYREFIDHYDPDHHINYHRIKSGGKDHLECGFVRVQFRGLCLYKEFVVQGKSLWGLQAAIDKARAYRDSLTTEQILLKKRAKQDCYSPTFPGIFDQWALERAWCIEGISPRTNKRTNIRFTMARYGSERLAMMAAIDARKELLISRHKNQEPRQLIDKYCHLFD